MTNDITLTKIKIDLGNKMLKHLEGMTERSYEDTMCRYRGPNGNMCAVGCLIPDEDYKTLIEGYPATQFFVLDRIPELKGLTEQDMEEVGEFLRRWQDEHDYSRNWTDTGMDKSVLDGLQVEIKELEVTQK